MRRALDVAAQALRTGDVPIGAVVVDAQGRELAAACNAREALGDPTAHAEVQALRAAAVARGEWRLGGATPAGTRGAWTVWAGAVGGARGGRGGVGGGGAQTGGAG